VRTFTFKHDVSPVLVTLAAVCEISISREGSTTTPSSNISDNSENTPSTTSLAFAWTSRADGGGAPDWD